MKSSTFFIKYRFQGYRCESRMSLCKQKIIRIYTINRKNQLICNDIVFQFQEFLLLQSLALFLINSDLGIFLKNDFWTPRPPPLNFVHGSYMLDMDIIDHVVAALGPESVLTNLTRGRSARPFSLS